MELQSFQMTKRPDGRWDSTRQFVSVQQQYTCNPIYVDMCICMNVEEWVSEEAYEATVTSCLVKRPQNKYEARHLRMSEISETSGGIVPTKRLECRSRAPAERCNSSNHNK